MKPNKFDAYLKVYKAIESCVEFAQVLSANKMRENFNHMFSDERDLQIKLRSRFETKRSEIIKKMGSRRLSYDKVLTTIFKVRTNLQYCKTDFKHAKDLEKDLNEIETLFNSHVCYAALNAGQVSTDDKDAVLRVPSTYLCTTYVDEVVFEKCNLSRLFEIVKEIDG